MKDLIKILFLFLATSIVAQSDSDDEVEEIVVKGNVLYSDQVNALKTPVPVINVPQTVTIVTDEDIRKQGFRQIGDIVRYTPGVNTSQGEGHRDAVVFRGVRSTADFYLDGMRDDVQYYRSLYNLEQVEILRGPNALLFGRGGTGGIINRVTKKATVGEVFGSVDAGFDSFGAFDVAGDYNMATGNNSALRINFHTDDLANHRDFYYGERVGFNPTLKVLVSDATTLDLSYEYADHERFIDRGIPTADGEPVERFEKIVFGDEDQNLQTLTANIMRANVSHMLSDTSKINISVLSSDYEKMYQNLYAAAYDAETNVVTMDGYYDPTERENFMMSANLVSELDFGGMKHTLLVGTEVIDTQNKNTRYDSYWITSGSDKESFIVTRPLDFSVTNLGVATAFDFATKLKSRTESDIAVSSFYVQDQIEVSDKVLLMLGGRMDTFDITVDDLKAGSSQSREDEEFSPRAGIVFKPRDEVSIYYSMSQSFLPRSGEQYKKLTASAAALDPDVFENTEFGMKWAISQDLSFTVSMFDSEQTIATRTSDGESAEIVGLQVDGVELELKGQVNDNLNIAVAYAQMDGETSTGGEPREIPKNTLSVFAQYRVNDKFGWALGFTDQGKSYISNNNTSRYLPEYTRVDFGAYYDVSSDLTLQVNVENVRDELYFPHSHSSHQASVGEPQNARLSLRYTF